jgi:hypothetical protein
MTSTDAYCQARGEIRGLKRERNDLQARLTEETHARALC